MSNHPILIGGVGLVKGRIKNLSQAMVAVCEEVRHLIEQSNAFEGMPFKEINMVIRWDENSVSEPEIGPLRKSNQSLEVSTTISLREGKAVENEPDQLELLVKSELTKVLKLIEAKYDMRQIKI